MTNDEIQGVVLRVLGRIAPEADLPHLRADADIRSELDIDSMDFLNFVIGLHKELGVEIPEADYHRLFTLSGSIEYLSAARR
jgi:acyl carrier protein